MKHLQTLGKLHSIQSLGALDGPGLRTVIVLQGCGFKCKFCHSIDTTLTDRGEEVTVGELVDRVMKNQPYWRKYDADYSNDADPDKAGGITITGGDPAVHPKFTADLLKEFKSRGVHTAVESPLHISDKVIDMWLPHVDLWMVSLKHMDDTIHQELTGKPNILIHKNLQYLDKQLTQMRLEDKATAKIRIRYVVIPGLHGNEVHLKQMGRLVSHIKNIEVFELLPYVSMGEYKWVELFGEYELAGTPNASSEDIARVTGYLKEFRLPVV